jgi:hypothetical protein
MTKKELWHLCPDGKWYRWSSRLRNRLPKSCPRCKGMLNQASVKVDRKSEKVIWFYRQDAYDEIGAPNEENMV